MAQSFNLPARNLPQGATIFGPFNIPVGTREFTMVLDVAQLVPGVFATDGSLISGQRVWVRIEYNTGAGWAMLAEADFSGPWHDKQQVLHNDVTLRFTFGGAAAQAGWQARVTFTVEGGAYDTAGGTLTLA